MLAARNSLTWRGFATVASAIQPPDRQIENARKGDPRRQRKEARRRDFIEPIERHDCRDDNQPLRDDIDHIEWRAVGSKEHPRPCRIKRKLDEKQRECRPTIGSSRQS